MIKLVLSFLLVGVVLLSSAIASAGILLGGTRIVYQQKFKETTIMVKNDGEKDIMVQSWIDPDQSFSEQDVPFALTPALSRLASKKQQNLRIFYAGKGLPSDKESVFWLSVQEIPQKSEADNTLQIAIRQRIKIFYRPEGLFGSVEESSKQLKWKIINEASKSWLVATNHSPFYISFGEVWITHSGKRYPVSAKMVGPGEVSRFLINANAAVPAKSASRVDYVTINDYGAPNSYTAEVRAN
ncbi:fimbrial biogenesis chaperone [Pseudomonas sp. DWP1b1]|uniref:fimbrial biogenesis chaperone n=1 Tax=unclassified Pseudomonas TaxID=196821 RepID=UPI003CEF05BB